MTSGPQPRRALSLAVPSRLQFGRDLEESSFSKQPSSESKTLNFKSIATAFIVLTLVFGVTTGYLLATRGGGTSTATFTTTAISTNTTTVTGVASGAQSVGIGYKGGIGFYLVNDAGMTLYYRTTDIQSNGTSTCTGSCVQVWPVFYVKNLMLPAGLNATSFNTVTRADGSQQLTYNGWPLYSFSGDHKAGDTNGQGIGGIWFALSLPAPKSPATSMTTTTTSTDAQSSTSSSTSTAMTTSTTSSASTTTSTTSTTRSTSTGYTYPY
jgi:predicted lipoprotein with Yx(FWY)xxD motif